jgi:Zn-dependent protease
MESNLHSEEKPFRVGIFAKLEQADEAVRNLLGAGFTDREISVVCSDKIKEQHFHRFEHEAPAGAHTGLAAASGATIGGLVGLLSMAAVATSTGGLGLLVFGPLFVSTAGAGAIVGGLVGAMTTRGLEDELANYYDQAVVQGKILVAVEAHGAGAPERLARAQQVLRQAGAEPVALAKG